MSHYDGPAFYRKRDKLKQRSTKKQVIDVKSEDVEIAVPPEAKPKSKREKKVVPKEKESEKHETDEVHAFRNFAKSHVITYNRAMNQQRFYDQILAVLAKSAESYYLFDVQNETAPKEPVNIKYISVNDQVNNNSKAPSEPVSPQEVSSEKVALDETTELMKDDSKTRPAMDSDSEAEAESSRSQEVHPTLTGSKDSTEEKISVEDDEGDLSIVTDKSALESQKSLNKEKSKPVAQSIAQRQAEKLRARLAQAQRPERPEKIERSVTRENTTIQQSRKLIKKEPPVAPKVRSFVQTPEKEPETTTLAYHFPPLDLLPSATADEVPDMSSWAEQQKETLDETLEAFHVAGSVEKYTIGPTVTQFEVALDRGVKVSKITNLNDDLRLALAAKDIRIEAPIPGRSTVGIEIPNLKSRPVLLSEVLNSQVFKQSTSPLTVALGVNLFGQPIIGDLAKMPHALIAGSTGSGKSVFINSLLTSLMYKATPEEVKLLLIDPKVVELAPYNGLPHLLAPVVSDTREASAALEWTVDEMEKRYQRFAAASVRNMEQFNQKAKEQGKAGLKMPYIVVIIDELADLMMSASNDVQDSIARITQKARAAGIHLIVATQRPSVDVVTGTIKNNIPTRIAFMVSSQIDSRTIIDASGAERLLGKGDMLFLGNGQNHPTRLQGTFINNEIDQVIDYVKQQRPSAYQFKASDLLKKSIAKSQEDELMPEILNYLTTEKTVSTSKLQRTFSIGYNRAANIIDDLEAHNYIGQSQGSKPRDVFFDNNDLEKINSQK